MINKFLNKSKKQVQTHIFKMLNLDNKIKTFRNLIVLKNITIKNLYLYLQPIMNGFPIHFQRLCNLVYIANPKILTY